MFALILFGSHQGLNWYDGKLRTVQVSAATAVVRIAYVELAIVLLGDGIRQAEAVGGFARFLILARSTNDEDLTEAVFAWFR